MDPVALRGDEAPLAAAFLARCKEPAALASRQRAEVEVLLRGLVAAGRAAWPEVELEERAFVGYLAERVAGAADATEALSVARAADLYLACACSLGEPRALAAFERRFLTPAAGALTRFGDARGFVDDVLQDLRERLFVGGPSRAPTITAYAGQGSLEAWVRVASVHLAIDRGRKEERERPTADVGDEVLLGAANPELDVIKAEHRDSFVRAFHDALATLAAQERTLLRLHVVDGLGLAELATIYGLHRASVARRIAGCRQRILDETRRLLRERLGFTPSELDSMIHLLHSQLDESLGVFLRSP